VTIEFTVPLKWSVHVDMITMQSMLDLTGMFHVLKLGKSMLQGSGRAKSAACRHDMREQD
jgi:hypothetical protein